MIMTAYRELLREYLPRPIRNERDYKKALRKVDDLMGHGRLSRRKTSYSMFSWHLWSNMSQFSFLRRAIHPTESLLILSSQRE